MNTDWPFQQAENTACFTTKQVLDGAAILRVHLEFSGDWHFYSISDDPIPNSDYKIVALSSVISLDSSLKSLHHLPYGWAAERTSSTAPWRVFKDNPYPSFLENGYYLEDAVWLSQHLSDITPPDEKIRENLQPGDYAKLVFRFAGETEERKDGECERMWVEVQEVDDIGNYVGILQNEPLHKVGKLGDAVSFHPLHIADVQ